MLHCEYLHNLGSSDCHTSIQNNNKFDQNKTIKLDKKREREKT